MKALTLAAIALFILAGCAPLASASTPPAASGPVTEAAGSVISTSTVTPEALESPEPQADGTATPRPHPPPPQSETAVPTLGPDGWKSLPVIPTLGPAMLAVYERGLAGGNDPTHFSKVGDCQNVSTYFLSSFDDPADFSLGSEYAYLQPTIDHFAGSWSRQSLAVKPGFNVAAVLSPLRADPDACEPGESPLDCEMRVWKPSVVIVR